MIVCLCEGVSDRQIRRVIRDGARTVNEVGRACGAGTGCGMCRVAVRGLLRQAEAAEAVGGTTLAVAAGPERG